MTLPAPPLPRPRRRLWRTLLKRPRDLRAFAERIPAELVLTPRPAPEEAAQWGEILLLEDHLVVLHPDGTASFRRHYVALLHGDEQLAAWDDVRRLYDRRQWRPTVYRAVLYGVDGGERAVPVSDRPLDNRGRARLLQVGFAPFLRPGVILEYEAQDDYFRPLPPGPCLWGQFFLRTGSPCRRRRLTVAVAAPFTAAVRLHHGAAAPVESAVGPYRVFRWEVRDAPGIERDPWIPPPRDFAPWIDFSTAPSWAPAAAQYRKDLVPEVLGPVQELARQLAPAAADPQQQARAAYAYVSRQIRYGRPPPEVALPASRPFPQMVQDLRGDCKDKAALLVALLRAYRISAQVAVVLTRLQGQTPFLPSQRFDHALVVAELDGRPVWLDPTPGLYPFGELPWYEQGVQALVLAEGTAACAETPPPRPELHGLEYICRGSLEADGGYRFQAQVTIRGDRAAELRHLLLNRSEAQRHRLIRQQAAQHLAGATLTAIRLDRAEDLAAELSYGYTAVLGHWGRRIERLLLLPIPWAEPLVSPGPLAAESRDEPLAAPRPAAIHERHEIELPSGFGGYGLPSETVQECPWASYRSFARVAEGRLVCERNLVFRGGIVPPAQFAEFKRFWEACVRAEAAHVVLVHEAAADTRPGPEVDGAVVAAGTSPERTPPP